jgi:hypothetical protein
MAMMLPLSPKASKDGELLLLRSVIKDLENVVS